MADGSAWSGEPGGPLKPVLVVLAHPRLEASRVNRSLADAARGIEGVTLHDLYETYPAYHIDVRREQKLLVEHAAVVMQFPMYWYSTPALLKEWIDLVWLHGFAYGEKGVRLRGKTLMVACSTGGDAHAYTAEGHHGWTLAEFLRPLQRTAGLCGMPWAEPHPTHDAPDLCEDGCNRAADAYADRLRALVAEVAR